jgi:polysaccharide biosynthesis transport protein
VPAENRKDTLVEIRQYAALLWRWLWLIVLCGAVAAGLAFAVSSQQEPVYASTSTLLIRTATGTGGQYNDASLRVMEGMLGTYAELMTKRPILAETIADLKLTMSPEELASKILVTVTPNTLLMTVTVRDTQPQRAADIANQLVNVLNRQEKDLLADPYAAYREALQVIEFAQPNRTPVSPLTSRNVLLALLIEYTNDTVKTSEDVQRLVGLPTLASISQIGGVPAKLITVAAPRSPIAEAYRMLIAQIEFAGIPNPLRSVMVTSAEAHEGKSTTVANLAVALAQNGKRVILVDADLRAPTLHRIFKLNNDLGLSTALLANDWKKLDELIQPTETENLRVLPSGVLPANPARLVGGERMAALASELDQRADIVLYDSPSALAVVDPTLLGRVCDATLLVVKDESTRAANIQRATAVIRQSGTIMLGVVLNNLSTQSPSYYGESANARGLRGWLARLRRPTAETR